VAVLLALFLLQPFGTARIGKIFGPVMAVWFLAIAALGVRGSFNTLGIAGPQPCVRHRVFVFERVHQFPGPGRRFLCVTGAEALYADMGHFGKKPIWLAWYGIVFPSLLLNYAGQSR
jgi:KUP system potassium uptake protein